MTKQLITQCSWVVSVKSVSDLSVEMWIVFEGQGYYGVSSKAKVTGALITQQWQNAQCGSKLATKY